MPASGPSIESQNMTNVQNADLLKATRLTNAGRLTEATALLQRMLGGGHTAPDVATATTTSAARHTPSTIEGVAEPAGVAPQGASRQPFSLAAGAAQALPGALRGFWPEQRGRVPAARATTGWRMALTSPDAPALNHVIEHAISLV